MQGPIRERRIKRRREQEDTFSLVTSGKEEMEHCRKDGKKDTE